MVLHECPYPNKLSLFCSYCWMCESRCESGNCYCNATISNPHDPFCLIWYFLFWSTHGKASFNQLWLHIYTPSTRIIQVLNHSKILNNNSKRYAVSYWMAWCRMIKWSEWLKCSYNIGQHGIWLFCNHKGGGVPTKGLRGMWWNILSTRVRV